MLLRSLNFIRYVTRIRTNPYSSIILAGGVGVQNLGKPAYIILARFIEAGCAFPKNDGNFEIDYILSEFADLRYFDKEN